MQHISKAESPVNLTLLHSEWFLGIYKLHLLPKLDMQQDTPLKFY